MSSRHEELAAPRRARGRASGRAGRALAGLAAVAVGLLGVTASVLPRMLELEEDPGLRWLFGLRGPLEPPEQVVVIGISRDSAEALGVSSDLDEWPRRLHAALIDRLAAQGAAVVVLDIMFEEAGDAEDDRQLAESIRAAGNVLLLEWVDARPIALPGLGAGSVLERRRPPFAPFADAALATAPFTLPTVPLRTSQFWPFGRTDGATPNLPAVALQAHLLDVYDRLYTLLTELLPQDMLGALPDSAVSARSRIVDTTRALRLLFASEPELSARVAAALDRSDPHYAAIRALVDLYAGPSSRYLNFYGPTRTVRTLEFEQVLRARDALGSDLAGKVVFVGYSELLQPSQEDDFISVYSERTGLNLSGVEIGATAFANLLDRRSVEPVGRGAHLLFVLGWGAVLTLALARLPNRWAVGAAVTAGTVWLAFASYRFSVAAIWWPTVIPLALQLPAALGVALYLNYRELAMQRERIQTALGYYVPPAVLTRLARERSTAPVGRELVYGTCLVSDAERFTEVSERLPADELGALMEAYYRVLTDVVERCGGFVADISGDSMVAIWTAMGSRAQMHRKSCEAALALRRAVEAFNQTHVDRALPTGFGLDSGQVLVGNINIAERYQYRAVGDIVNTASRIQGLNRLLGTRVLASAVALDPLQTGLASRRLGRFLLRGKSAPLEISELLEPEDALEVDARRRFEQALEAFSKQQWQAARRAFLDVLEARPDDGPSRFYAGETARCERTGVAPGWDGTLRITVK